MAPSPKLSKSWTLSAGVKVTLKDTKNSGKNGGVERHQKYGERRDEEDLLYDEE